jgi:hypothetical protein
MGIVLPMAIPLSSTELDREVLAGTVTSPPSNALAQDAANPSRRMHAHLACRANTSAVQGIRSTRRRDHRVDSLMLGDSKYNNRSMEISDKSPYIKNFYLGSVYLRCNRP